MLNFIRRSLSVFAAEIKCLTYIQYDTAGLKKKDNKKLKVVYGKKKMFIYRMVSFSPNQSKRRLGIMIITEGTLLIKPMGEVSTQCFSVHHASYL